MKLEFLTDEENSIVDQAFEIASGAVAHSDAYKLNVVILKLAAKVSGQDLSIPPAYDPIKSQPAIDLSTIDPSALRAHLAALDAGKINEEGK
jgi:hypothetical protein